MSKFQELTDDYSRTAVPDEKRVSGLRIAMILVGMVITVPAFLAGAEIGSALSVTNSVIVFASAGLLVACLAALTGYVGAANGLSTSMILRFAFGARGAIFVNAILSLGLLGWFGVTAELFAQLLFQSMADFGFTALPTQLYLLLGVSLVAVTVLFGFRSLNALSLAAVPAMLAFLALVAWRSLSEHSVDGLFAERVVTLDVGTAISATAGGLMIGVAVMPDLCRYAFNGRHAILASFVAYLIGWPMVMAFSAIPAILYNQTNLLETISALSLGGWGLALLVLATWTTNANNLYSSSLFLSAVARQTDKWQLVILGSIIGAVIAGIGISEQFIEFLLLLGVAIPPVAGIYLADYFVVKKRRYNFGELERQAKVNVPAFLAWFAGFLLGHASNNGSLSLTGIPGVDSIVLAVALYSALSSKWVRKIAPW